jgi:hypothetical protein
MELADPRLIEELRRGRNRARTPGPRMPRAKPEDRVYQPRSAMGARCRCGTCATCLENVRWERIFNEKFADPGYYTREAALPHNSPLKEN